MPRGVSLSYRLFFVFVGAIIILSCYTFHFLKPHSQNRAITEDAFLALRAVSVVDRSTSVSLQESGFTATSPNSADFVVTKKIEFISGKMQPHVWSSIDSNLSGVVASSKDHHSTAGNHTVPVVEHLNDPIHGEVVAQDPAMNEGSTNQTSTPTSLNNIGTVVVLTPENFDQSVFMSGEFWFVKFFAPYVKNPLN